jgi:hypothetical protein
MTFKSGGSGGNVAHYHSGEQLLLAGKSGVNGRLAGAGEAGDLIHAGAGQSAFQKDPPGGIQNAGVYLTGQFPRRSPNAHGTAPADPHFLRWHRAHGAILTRSRLHPAGPP